MRSRWMVMLASAAIAAAAIVVSLVTVSSAKLGGPTVHVIEHATSDTVIEGGHVRAIMTSAPFPIPIDMKGSFKMYRLTDPPKAKKQDK